MPSSFQSQLEEIDEEDRYRVEERAAMMQFDGIGCSQEESERLALIDYWRWFLAQPK